MRVKNVSTRKKNVAVWWTFVNQLEIYCESMLKKNEVRMRNITKGS